MSAPEQFAMLARLGEALGSGLPGFHASSEHGHFHLAPSVPAGTRLTTGGADPLLPLLLRDIDLAKQVDLAVAFAMTSGVKLLLPWFRDLLARGGRLRIVVGDYLDVTEPQALWQILDLEAQAFVHETGTGSFHPKAWLFRAEDRTGRAVVGSSNLSQTALTSGVEWNLHSEGAADAVEAAFEELLRHPKTRPLTPDWIEAYAARRDPPPASVKLVAEEPLVAPPEPHPIQAAALEALKDTRAKGHGRGLVVLATGLGKTWLAAFDSAPFARVLFVAHREEILTQAMTSFRRIRPDARIGRYDGTEKDASADLVFASIQTLGAAAHLRRFSPDAFDYIVVDEFHHASAASYRGLLAHFTPRFLLGLTATPDRSDGADLLALCEDNLVFSADLFQGIEAGLLSPFAYVGVPDDIDYGQIPWRSNRFDPAELEAKLATEARAENAFQEWQKHRAGPAIGFCCSMRHADFMAEYFRAKGIKAASVHSGPSSAPRASSLLDLREGRLEILFAVDMFNEGVDLPEVATVLMLRPTESVIIWLQQLGRGLRKLPDKVLKVVDYIGNHRIFLTKLRALLGGGPGDRSLSQRLDQAMTGRLELPPGCSVTYELETIEILRGLLRPKAASDELEAQYRDFHLRNGLRPTASEIAAMGFDPARTGHGGWFDFVRDMGDSVPPALTTHGGLLRQVEREATISREDLTALEVMAGGGTTTRGLRLWAVSPFFRHADTGLTLARHGEGLGEMIAELADWRLAQTRAKEAAEAPALYVTGPELWREYFRQDIAGLFGLKFNEPAWRQGIVPLGKRLILLTTLEKEGMSAGHEYDDRFLSAQKMQWASQNKTRRTSLQGRILNGTEPGGEVHLFVRKTSKRGSKAAPFLYCGRPRFLSWEGEAPITVTWELQETVPAQLRRALGVPEEAKP
ncbi:DUF3427 domain-containing protein [Rhodobacteraceae bacterium CYK-10]|uniref:DUF3427 domain-containing protein n=2 Tax=Stagnihabitans tardus TaxID=2699202 RepID=A0AAE4Y806_9RHOB|nr:DUF3427 domain-containing protein [Stagnihabitans tardus]